MSKLNSNKLRNVVWTLLVLWLVGALLAGYIGVFDAGSPYSMSVPIPLGLGAILPVVLFGIWFQVSGSFREYVLSLNPAVLTAVQSWRVGGIVFLVLLAKGVLPPSFAYPAGFGDIAIGLTALFIAWAFSRKKLSTNGFILWQLAGVTDLVAAVVTGVLSSPTRTGILAHGATTRVMGLLPMSLIPTFAVPLLFILHIICIAQARRAPLKSPGLYTALSKA